eukprot:1008430-Pleurochrysis_carterae.AAC.1
MSSHLGFAMRRVLQHDEALAAARLEMRALHEHVAAAEADAADARKALAALTGDAQKADGKLEKRMHSIESAVSVLGRDLRNGMNKAANERAKLRDLVTKQQPVNMK